MGRAQLIDWGSADSHLFLNPRLPASLAARIQLKKLPRLPNHIWLGSSGTTSIGQQVLYALSKTAFLIAAEAANQHLDTNNKDTWLLTLPLHHVGGLSIFARAYMGGHKVVDRSQDPWAPEKFHHWVQESRATLASLVPTQIYDLVQMGKKAPPSLRAIVVGGSALTESLYLQARELGFPCLPSFGATEVCSQIATAELKSLSGDAYPELRVLAHIEPRVDDHNILSVKSAALFTARVDVKPSHMEVLWRCGEWYAMKDLAELSFDESRQDLVWLHHKGRSGDLVKISGELVNVAELAELFANITDGAEAAIVAVPDKRKGYEMSVVFTNSLYDKADAWVKAFNEKVLPVARIYSAYFVHQIPKSDLNKILVGQLKANLGLG